MREPLHAALEILFERRQARLGARKSLQGQLGGRDAALRETGALVPLGQRFPLMLDRPFERLEVLADFGFARGPSPVAPFRPRSMPASAILRRCSICCHVSTIRAHCTVILASRCSVACEYSRLRRHSSSAPRMSSIWAWRSGSRGIVFANRSNDGLCHRWTFLVRMAARRRALLQRNITLTSLRSLTRAARKKAWRREINYRAQGFSHLHTNTSRLPLSRIFRMRLVRRELLQHGLASRSHAARKDEEVKFMFTAHFTRRLVLALGLAVLLAAPRPTSAQSPYSGIVVFGTSLSDPGNAFALTRRTRHSRRTSP